MPSAIETADRPELNARPMNPGDYERAVRRVMVSSHGGRHLDRVCAEIAAGVASPAIAAVP